MSFKKLGSGRGIHEGSPMGTRCLCGEKDHATFRAFML